MTVAPGLAQFARQGFPGFAKLAGDRGQKDGLARHDDSTIAQIATRDDRRRPLHRAPIRASSRAFPAGGEGIDPGYAHRSIPERGPIQAKG